MSRVAPLWRKPSFTSLSLEGEGLLPTMLDALGLLENFSVREHAGRMSGDSLLRPYRPRGPIPVTNCTLMFPCPLNTWGLFADDHKLIAQAWDADWRCLDASGGEHLVSRDDLPLLPNGSPNR